MAAVRGLRQRFAGNLIIWGSLSLSDALLRAGQVDVRLRVLPLLTGGGRCFAPRGLGLRPLTLASARSFAQSLVVLEYHAALPPAHAAATRP